VRIFQVIDFYSNGSSHPHVLFTIVSPNSLRFHCDVLRFDSLIGPRFYRAMPALTRRSHPEARDECWRIHYGDVLAGTIAIRTGIPHDTDPWEWCCGFYPGSRPRECTSGTAETFDEARADFEEAWRVFLSNRTDADVQAWRDQRDWTERKYAMWTRGERNSLMKCPCGETFDSHRLEHT
jgi:hypothetical protein